MTTKQKDVLLKTLKASWLRAYKSKASHEILTGLETAIAAVEFDLSR